MVKKPIPMVVTPKQLVIAAGLIALVLFAYGYTNRVIENRMLQAQVTRWEEEVRAAEERLARSQAQLEHVQTDAYVIEEARSDLGYTFPDEVAVRTVPQDEAPETLAAESAPVTTPGWQQWWERFFGR